MEYYLECQYDARQSFYKKAKVVIEEDNICFNELLYSYGTLVAIYTKDKMSALEQFSYLGKYSQTTSKLQSYIRSYTNVIDEVDEISL